MSRSKRITYRTTFATKCVFSFAHQGTSVRFQCATCPIERLVCRPCIRNASVMPTTMKCVCGPCGVQFGRYNVHVGRIGVPLGQTAWISSTRSGTTKGARARQAWPSSQLCDMRRSTAVGEVLELNHALDDLAARAKTTVTACIDLDKNISSDLELIDCIRTRPNCTINFC